MLNKNTLGVRKVRGKSEATCNLAGVTKSFDISWGQEVTLSLILLTPWMTYNSLQHIFTIGFVTWPPFWTNIITKMAKPIVKICYELLYVIQGVISTLDKITSWPQLISNLLVAPTWLHVTSDWSLYPRCFWSYIYFEYLLSYLLVSRIINCHTRLL